MKDELCHLYTEVNMLLDVSKMMDNYKFKSPETRAWVEGGKFALKNVLKLIEERVENEGENINTIKDSKRS